MPKKTKKKTGIKDVKDEKDVKKKTKYLKTKNGRYYKKLPSGRCRFVSKKEAEGS